MTAAQRKESELVYRRTRLSDNSTPPVGQLPAQARSIAPTITPIIIGFLLLLGLITGLGLLSAKQMDQVSFNARDLVSQNSAHQSVLLNLRLAVTKLDNEARTQSEAEARRELKPPFDLRLSTAREEVKKRLAMLDRPPLSENPAWQKARNDINEFVKISVDIRRYGLEGYMKFRTINEDLNGSQVFWIGSRMRRSTKCRTCNFMLVVRYYSGV